MSVGTVTVAIPTRNQEVAIAGTIQELAKQTRQPNRVLIADYSDDRTAEMARSYAGAAAAGYDLDIFEVDEPGVGAAREALRERADPGLLVCLDAEVHIDENWLAEHVAIHESVSEPCVVSGPWPGQAIGAETRVFNPTEADHPAYFIEANCSMSTATAERVGGWDPAFQRGCDWDFRYRLAQTEGVVAVASERVRAHPYSTNNSPRLHLRKARGRPSSVPFIRKYGLGYLGFHPLHAIGDAVGVSALLSVAGAAVWPPAILWALACFGAYVWQFDPPGFTLRDRLLASPAVFLLGWTALAAVMGE